MNSLAAQSIGRIVSLPASGYSTGNSQITSVHKLAVCYHTQKNYEQAERLYLKALSALRNSVGQTAPEFGQVLNNLARLYHTLGRHEEAEPLYKQSLAVPERHYGEYNPKVARRLANLAELYCAMGRHEESIVHYQRAIAIVEREFGPTHPTTVKTLRAFAAMLKTMNRTADGQAIEKRLGCPENLIEDAHQKKSEVLEASL